MLTLVENGELIKRPMKDDGELGAEANPECHDEMNVVNIPSPKSWKS